MKQRTVVISGAEGYLGHACAEVFREAGWQVVGITRRGTESCDVGDARAVKLTFKTIAEKFGEIEAAIHAAATPLDRRELSALSAEEFEAQIQVAGLGAFNFFKEATRLMHARGVCIGITTAALEKNTKVERVGAYIAAKYLLRGLLRTLAAQVAAGIRVYAIAPGFLPGGLNGDLPEGVSAFILSKLPTHNRPEDIALLALALAEESGTFPSGTSIEMPGRVVTPL